jgi:hypothetical protein
VLYHWAIPPDFPGWPWTRDLPQPPKCWSYRHVPPVKVLQFQILQGCFQPREVFCLFDVHFFSSFLFLVLGLQPSAWSMLGKCWTTELHLQLFCFILNRLEGSWDPFLTSREKHLKLYFGSHFSHFCFSVAVKQFQGELSLSWKKSGSPHSWHIITGISSSVSFPAPCDSEVSLGAVRPGCYLSITKLKFSSQFTLNYILCKVNIYLIFLPD